MNDLNAAVADLRTLANAYSKRSGFGIPTEDRTPAEVYNGRQFGRFANAADYIEDAIKAAAAFKLAADAAEVEEDEDPTAGFLVEAAWDRIA